MKNIDALTHYHNIFLTMHEVHCMDKEMSQEEVFTRLESIEKSIDALKAEQLWFVLKNQKEIIKYFGATVHGYCSIFNFKAIDYNYDPAGPIEVDAIGEESHYFALPLYIDIMQGVSCNLNFSLKLLDIFIKHGFEIDNVFTYGADDDETLLYSALLTGSLEYAKELIKRGADIDKELTFKHGKAKISDDLLKELQLSFKGIIDEEARAAIDFILEYTKSIQEKKMLSDTIGLSQSSPNGKINSNHTSKKL